MNVIARTFRYLDEDEVAAQRKWRPPQEGGEENEAAARTGVRRALGACGGEELAT